MNERILIVEDDPSISKLLSTNLAVAAIKPRALRMAGRRLK